MMVERLWDPNRGKVHHAGGRRTKLPYSQVQILQFSNFGTKSLAFSHTDCTVHSHTTHDSPARLLYRKKKSSVKFLKLKYFFNQKIEIPAVIRKMHQKTEKERFF
jgi:hypothetical protein